jgi:hypothetical protein
MIDTGIIITGAVGIVTTVVSSFATWLFSRKKYNAEVSHDEIINMKESLEFYKDLSESNQRTLTEILNKSEELANANIKLLIEVQNLKMQVSTLLQVINVELGDIDFSKYGIEVENGTIVRKKVSKE